MTRTSYAAAVAALVGALAHGEGHSAPDPAQIETEHRERLPSAEPVSPPPTATPSAPSAAAKQSEIPWRRYLENAAAPASLSIGGDAPKEFTLDRKQWNWERGKSGDLSRLYYMDPDGKTVVLRFEDGKPQISYLGGPDIELSDVRLGENSK